MARTEIDVKYGQATFTQNGAYRARYPELDKTDPHTLTFEWLKGTPAGTLTLSVDGDPGLNNVVDLAVERVRNFVGKPVFIDLGFAGLPAGCELAIHFR